MPTENSVITREHLPGLLLARTIWENGGPSLYFPPALQDATDQARAALPAPASVPDGYMPIPTAEQLADALENVRSFHDMSAELIAPLLANLLAATTVKAELPEPDFALDGGSQPCYYAETVQRIVAALSAQQSAHVSVPRELLDAVKELFDAKQAKEDFERENPGNSTKRWDACLYRIDAAEDALRALLNGGEA